MNENGPAVILVILTLLVLFGIGIAVATVHGNGENPAVSGPCPVLTADSLNGRRPYHVSEPFLNLGWHRKYNVNDASSGGGLTDGKEVTLENRCYNFMMGSSKVFLDGKLVAYSKNAVNDDGLGGMDMYDCTGKRFAYIAFGFVKGMEAFNDRGTKIWISGRPVAFIGDTTTVRAQPSDASVATIEYRLPSLSTKLLSGFTVTFAAGVDVTLPALDPRLNLMILARVLTLASGRDNFDPCNSFVYGGGIFCLTVVSLPVLYVLGVICMKIKEWWDGRRK